MAASSAPLRVGVVSASVGSVPTVTGEFPVEAALAGLELVEVPERSSSVRNCEAKGASTLPVIAPVLAKVGVQPTGPVATTGAVPMGVPAGGAQPFATDIAGAEVQPTCPAGGNPPPSAGATGLGVQPAGPTATAVAALMGAPAGGAHPPVTAPGTGSCAVTAPPFTDVVVVSAVGVDPEVTTSALAGSVEANLLLGRLHHSQSNIQDTSLESLTKAGSPWPAVPQAWLEQPDP